MEIKVTEEEINKVLNRCAENTDAGKSEYPGMSYEDGVQNALNWVLRHWDDKPFDD